MTAKAYIRHRMSGRTRLKVPECRGDAGYFDRLVAHVRAYPGVNGVQGNPQTASLLIDHGVTFTELADRAARDGLFEVAYDTLAPIVESPGRPAAMAAAQAYRLPGRPQLLPALAVGFAGLGIYQVARRDILAPATTLFWYALSAMLLARARRDPPPL